MGFSGWVQEQLRLRGWSQMELVRRSGMNQATLSRLVNDLQAPDIDDYARIARGFGLPLADVLKQAGVLVDGALEQRLLDWKERLEKFDETDRDSILSVMEAVLTAAERLASPPSPVKEPGYRQ